MAGTPWVLQWAIRWINFVPWPESSRIAGEIFEKTSRISCKNKVVGENFDHGINNNPGGEHNDNTNDRCGEDFFTERVEVFGGACDEEHDAACGNEKGGCGEGDIVEEEIGEVHDRNANVAKVAGRLSERRDPAGNNGAFRADSRCGIGIGRDRTYKQNERKGDKDPQE